MRKTITVPGTIRTQVEVDPINVLQSIHPIPAHDWIEVKEDKFIQMTEVSAGQHSFEKEVGEVSKDIYEVWMAKQTLIKFLNEQK